MDWAIGVDIGGTKIEAALVDERGAVEGLYRQATQADLGPAVVLDRLQTSIRIVLDQAPGPVRAVGIGFAGQVDASSGVVYYAPNLPGWRDVPLKAKLESTLGLPVFVLNDVHAAAWAEWTYGAGQGWDDLVCVFIGTGVGGGVILGGRLQTGASGSLGEVGHMPIVADGRACRCGGRGCLEAYIGGWAIAEQVRQDIQAHWVEWGDVGPLEAFTAETLADLCQRGHSRAQAWSDRLGRYLGIGMVGVVNVLNPRGLILGGGVLQGFPEWLTVVAVTIQALALPSAARTVEVRRAGLGRHGGLIGAAAWARWQLQKEVTG
ncbi:MAG: ROK family protein [Acidobacteria bacterium]|nr:ROK family protein [Acidobacteriota bacterium]MDW7984575.1 ROK family protein [Acidobacteriota bacterium]